MLSLRTPIGLGAALSASLAASLLSIAPAQAQNQAPSGNQWLGGVEGTSKPTDCASFVLGANIFSGSFACTAGDKIYSSFTKILDTSDHLQNSIFQFTAIGTNHTLSALGNFTPGTYQFGYTMTVFDALNTGQRLESADTAANSSNIAPGVPSWVKTLSVDTVSEDLSLTTFQAGGAVIKDGPKDFNPASQPVSADFISKLVVNNLASNSVQGITDSVTQNFQPGETVPGPLPILGAAAAFGCSRKLRTRIKQAA